jgi:hypothetical protein
MMTESRPETRQEPRSAFGEVLAEIMAARGRKTDDDAIVQLGEEAFGLHDPESQRLISALLDLARDDGAWRDPRVPTGLARALGLTADEKDRLGYSFAWGVRQPGQARSRAERDAARE